eukprot:scaffold113035_cov35-Tisochrysis_lutea.AAC.2
MCCNVASLGLRFSRLGLFSPGQRLLATLAYALPELIAPPGIGTTTYGALPTSKRSVQSFDVLLLTGHLGCQSDRRANIFSKNLRCLHKLARPSESCRALIGRVVVP